MGDIYQNGYINIAATSSSSGAEGLYYSCRNVTLIQTADISAKWANCPRGTFQAYMFHEWDRKVSKSVLLSRAWVTQEVTLARRDLHFSRDQLFWQCCESHANEGSPNGLPNMGVSKLSVSNIPFPYEQSSHEQIGCHIYAMGFHNGSIHSGFSLATEKGQDSSSFNSGKKDRNR